MATGWRWRDPGRYPSERVGWSGVACALGGGNREETARFERPSRKRSPRQERILVGPRREFDWVAAAWSSEACVNVNL